MSTSKAKQDVDYRRYAQEHGPDPDAIRRGTGARRARREAAAKQRITIRIDEELIREFKALVPEGKGYQGLINQALREWLTARGIKELVRDELTETIQRVVASRLPKAG